MEERTIKNNNNKKKAKNAGMSQRSSKSDKMTRNWIKKCFDGSLENERRGEGNSCNPTLKRTIIRRILVGRYYVLHFREPECVAQARTCTLTLITGTGGHINRATNFSPVYLVFFCCETHTDTHLNFGVVVGFIHIALRTHFNLGRVQRRLAATTDEAMVALRCRRCQWQELISMIVYTHTHSATLRHHHHLLRH